MDDTRIDAAPTPAHIFAYRAFRSVFVRSPESSPVRPAPSETQHLNDNKENIRHATARGSRFVTSPVRSKRDAELAVETLNLSLTPKRQCVNPVSPTKSILKKSNVPTPRRAGLRDVTVTFKDISMSTSPELTRRGSPIRVRSQPELRNTLASLSTVEISAPVLRPTPAARVEGSKVAGREEITLPAPADFDIDSYVGQTEKEMRRLIKYGQKWRAQAKKQEEENARLKAQIDELRKENDRLNRKNDALTQPAGLSISTDITNPLKLATTDTEKPKSNIYEARLESRKRRASQEKWRVPFDTINTKKQRSRSSNEPERSQKHYEIQHNSSKATRYATRESDLVGKSDKKIVKEQPQRVSYEIDARQLKEENIPVNDMRKLKPDHLDKVYVSAESLEAASQPPPPEEDRKAAARERLRLKREAKVASVRASSAPKSQANKFGQDTRGDNEESQVDWMAIA